MAGENGVVPGWHRMPFESWREACFAVPGMKKEMAR
jgi:hypothetical protein